MYRQDFWYEVFKWHGSVSPYIAVRVLIFCGISVAVHAVVEYTGVQTGLGVAPYEIVGVVLALILVTRTNAGYDRWYEARKLWGGMVNQCRNLATIGAVYGPQNRDWQAEFARWVAVFPHACMRSLRGDTDWRDVERLLSPEQTAQLAAAPHSPTYVANRIAQLLHEAMRSGQFDRFAFIQAEHERSSLIDHIGGCERIMKTPLARVFSIKIRHFLFVYLIALPIAIVDKTGVMTPIIVLLVAYPLLSLDQIGMELQNPFSVDSLSHLPLADITATIERNIFDQQKYLQASGPLDIPAANRPQPAHVVLSHDTAILNSTAN
ncbi:bestrophin family protein [Anatilimnocola floriformis]|uniref:bestrophin family protein n=1 Tax=Anatilimnocola floriformis TaxID=2948575 RepID=UPI0020C1F702|nr:bestrophin family ion channel [Anatilimnocola floriformis]